MKTSALGKMLILASEALVLNRYKDIKNIWTIGGGVTARAGASINPETYTGKMTIVECLDLFNEILPKYEAGVDKALDGRHVTQHEYDALVSLAYNVGPGLGPTTYKYIRRGDIVGAIKLWSANPELASRRQHEVDLARFGEYPENPKAWVLSADSHGKLLWSSTGRKVNLMDYSERLV